MSNTTIGRQPVQIFEIEQPSCSNEYGVLPCTASGTSKCFNTRATCQDTTNYNQDDTIFWRFSHARQDLIDTYEDGDDYVKTSSIPSLKSVSTVPTKINPGDGSADLSVLGRRASVTITLSDHQYDDSFSDKYIDDRSYNAFDVGTFWGKWIARNKYFTSWVCRVYEGYVGENLQDMVNKTYIISSISGANSSGSVSIVAKDPLSLADDSAAIMPPTSELVLYTDIDDSQTTGIVIDGTETDISDEMGNTGTTRYLRIDNEIILYTGYTESSELLTLTGVVRGELGTTAADHDADEAAQRVIRYEDYPSWQIASDGILNYSSVPGDYIDTDAWDEEGNLWLSPFTFSGTIEEPTAVVDIVSELARDSMFFIWWDEKTQLINLRALSPVSGTITGISSDTNVIKNSFSLSSKPSERISRSIIYFNRKDPTESDDEISNYSSVRITVDGDSESEFLYDEVRTSPVYSRWIQSDSQALQVGTRTLEAFVDTPEYMTLSMDAKDRDIWTADVINVTVDQIQNEFGQPATELWQVISAEEIEFGDTIKYQLRKFTFQIDRAAYWTEDDQVDYEEASEADKLEGNAWWSDDDGLMPNGDDGYRWT